MKKSPKHPGGFLTRRQLRGGVITPRPKFDVSGRHIGWTNSYSRPDYTQKHLEERKAGE